IEFDSYRAELQMMHPEMEPLNIEDDEGEGALHVGRVVPIYEAAGKVSTRAIRTLVHRILSQIAPLEDRLPEYLRLKLKLPDRWTATQQLHFPPPDSDLRMLNAFR